MSVYNSESEESRIALASALEKKLRDCKFVLELSEPGREKIYSLPINDTGMFIQVYTSIVGNQVRNYAKDAIRVAGIYRCNGASRGITSDARVNRTGEIDEIVDRMYQRMKAAWKNCCSSERCDKCGAPKFVSKNGNKVCAAICWVKQENSGG